MLAVSRMRTLASTDSFLAITEIVEYSTNCISFTEQLFSVGFLSKVTQAMNSEAPTAMGWGKRDSVDIMNYILLACMNGRRITSCTIANWTRNRPNHTWRLQLKHRLLEKRETGSFNKNVFHATVLARKYTDAYSERRRFSLSLPMRTRRSSWSEGR